MNQLPDSLSGMVSSISNLILGQGGGGRAGSGEQESRDGPLFSEVSLFLPLKTGNLRFTDAR